MSYENLDVSVLLKKTRDALSATPWCDSCFKPCQCKPDCQGRWAVITRNAISAIDSWLDSAAQFNPVSEVQALMVAKSVLEEAKTTMGPPGWGVCCDLDKCGHRGGCPGVAVDAAISVINDALASFAIKGGPWDIILHLQRQRAFSLQTFGPGPRTAGICDHMRKELREIEEDPDNLEEWVDAILLAFDGAWRTGASPVEIVSAIEAKMSKNEARAWPDWRTVDTDKAIEHFRGDVD